MTRTLFKERKYIGKYIATKNFDDSVVLGCGNTPEEAYKSAVQKGCKRPMIVFVPSKEMVQIYLQWN